ncbi:hypothetical protein [Pandoraea oxalativorans]|uniref:Uncharacterized protein n=1 Tax=Pandoraea oxalativorans TaxID=573737 RepID=A0A0E3YFU4_9BURK|nr:hypothetical protein [Pandoraea oxalativorans]AKC72690.2 hypothetical protein MB84_22800 [Pandoraea oxalativorans]
MRKTDMLGTSEASAPSQPSEPRHHTRRASRWIGAAGTFLCLTLTMSVQAASGNGVGTQGPADSTPAQGPTSGQMQSQNSECSKDAPSDQAIVGKSLTEARSMLQGCPWRIGMQDGKTMPMTRDHRPERRTLTIENDKVTSVTRG